MSEQEEKTEAKVPRASLDRGSRKRMVMFVAVFVVCVLALLIGYRYASSTLANDWYLFHVAQHTSYMLSFIGYSSSVERPDRIREDPEYVRAFIQATREGTPPPEKTEPSGEDVRPLSGWEAYQYRIARFRTDDQGGGVSGPSVAFVLRPGIVTKISETRKELEALSEDTGLDEDTRTARREALNARLKDLEAQREEARKGGDETAQALRDKAFPFTVVPDCGAIPSMSIFFAAVLAFPTRWWKRIVGIVTGIPILYLVNCFRLACLAVIGSLDRGSGHGGKVFTFAHEYVWQGIYIVFVVAVWMIWVEYVVRGKKTCPPEAGSDK